VIRPTEQFDDFGTSLVFGRIQGCFAPLVLYLKVSSLAKKHLYNDFVSIQPPTTTGTTELPIAWAYPHMIKGLSGFVLA
jgi:hypothetical protein